MAEREWRPPWLVERFFRLAPYGFPKQILMILADGDKTFPEILEGFRESLHEWQDAQAGCAEIHRVLRSPEPACPESSKSEAGLSLFVLAVKPCQEPLDCAQAAPVQGQLI